MRPKLRVLGVVTDDDAATDVAGVETQSFDEVVADPSSTVVDEPVATPLVAAASAVSTLNFNILGRALTYHIMTFFAESRHREQRNTRDIHDVRFAWATSI